jgi:ketosteroid isomerase-like protein
VNAPPRQDEDVARANLQVVARAYEHLNRGDVDALVELCHPEFRLDMSERVFNPATYDGHEGVRRFYAEVREVWEEFRWDPERLMAAGGRVVALLHSHGRGRGSGVEIDRRNAMLWTLERGHAVSARLYVDQEQARDAVAG